MQESPIRHSTSPFNGQMECGWNNRHVRSAYKSLPRFPRKEWNDIVIIDIPGIGECDSIWFKRGDESSIEFDNNISIIDGKVLNLNNVSVTSLKVINFIARQDKKICSDNNIEFDGLIKINEAKINEFRKSSGINVAISSVWNGLPPLLSKKIIAKYDNYYKIPKEFGMDTIKYSQKTTEKSDIFDYNGSIIKIK